MSDCVYSHATHETRNDLNTNTFQHTGSVPSPATGVEYGGGIIYDIPGLGEKYEDCGKVFKFWTCDKCGFVRPIKSRCDRPECPECWKSWANHEKRSVVDRITGFKEAYKVAKGRRLGNPQDLILSPPQDYAKALVLGPGGVEKLRKRAVLLIRRAGIRGGLIVFHPYRIKKKYKAALLNAGKFKISAKESNKENKSYEERREERKKDKKFWKLIQEDALGLGDWRLYVYLSPHFHLIGYGSAIDYGKFYENSKKNKDSQGWICKFKGHLSKEKDISKAVYYFLTHCAIRKGKRSVTWFGSLSYNRLSKTKRSVEYVVKRCPVCGADLMLEYELTGLREEAIEKIVTWVYKMKSKPPPKQIKLPWVF